MPGSSSRPSRRSLGCTRNHRHVRRARRSHFPRDAAPRLARFFSSCFPRRSDLIRTESPVMRRSEIRKIAFVGDYLPRKCGIATFTHDMHASVAARYPDAECFVVPVNDRPEGYDYPPEVRFEIEEQNLESYVRAADFLNFANTDVVCLQHEYGIYGGTAGSHILGLLRDLRMPVVTTLHTVLREPNDDQRRVLTELASLSARVVVMTERARAFLGDIYRVPEAKIDLIAHGIP